MEKLQAALEKARKNRGEVLDEAVGAHAGSLTKPRAAQMRDQTSVDALWEALPRLDLKEENLIKHRIVTRAASPSAAPFDILRTKVLLQMRQNGWKRLAITSPMPKSGKTTTACNLALGLGRQGDLRAILMDLDLRDPSVDRFFEARPPHGIGDLLTGKVDFQDQALRFGDNVACSMALHPEADPTRMLLADETAEVIERIESTYKPDVMIFDLPSVLVNDDTRAFLKNADCALIVIRANATRYSQLDTCEREIAEQTNVVGVVLNAYNTASAEPL